MIAEILQALEADDWYNESEAIEIAKGKYHAKTKTKDIIEQNKRRWLRLKKR